uniref:Uncharacterized LOC111239835 n=1 Tax=Seriola dumerili TaxID=41447 RepID=A0A3B4VR03_SERDU
MATDFTQDAVLHFLQSSGSSVKNSDLLLHFRNFIRNHADQDRNRELFKKFVNSVATVRQQDGVSYVVLRKKFRRHIPGDGGGGSSGPPRFPGGRNTELSPESTNLSPAMCIEKPRLKPQLRGATTPAPPGETSKKTILPAAGIIFNNNSNNNNVETNLNLKQQQVNSTFEQISVKTELDEPPIPNQCTKVAKQGVGFGLLPGITPVVPAVRHHGEASQQVPVPQSLRGREACLCAEGGLHQEPPLHTQVAPRRFRHRQSYKSAVSYDEDEEEEDEVTVRQGSAGGLWPPSAPLGDTGRAISASLPCIIDTPVPPSVVSYSSSSLSERNLPEIYIQDVEVLSPRDPGWSFQSGIGLKGQWMGTRLEHMSVLAESTSIRPNQPSEAVRYTSSPGRAKEASPYHNIYLDCQYSQASGVQLEPRPGLHQSQRSELSSSPSLILSPASPVSFSSSEWPLSGSSRGSGEFNKLDLFSCHQSLVPLELREHAWLVKGAAGAWPDIYSLFREDSSLLNKQDFISGFTVLHWIAKHGDHRVLNTLWYGVQKAGLMFDINARSTCGHTPLHIAAIHGNKNIMRLLVNKFNADVRLRDTAGKRAWQYLSCNTPLDIFQLLGGTAQTQRRRRRLYHLSSASSGERPLTIAGTARVKRSSSIAAFLKHKSLRRFHGHQSDSSV